MSDCYDSPRFVERLGDERWLEYYSNNPITRLLIRNFFAELKKVIGLLESDDKILEVGCGTGESSRWILSFLSGQHFEVSEVENQYVEKLRDAKFPVTVTQESVCELKRDQDDFDCIFLLEVLEHLEDYELALKELFRVSRKYVVISIPNEPLWRILNCLRGRYLKNWGNTPGHINHWSTPKILKIISKYGVVREVYTPMPWIIVLAEVN